MWIFIAAVIGMVINGALPQFCPVLPIAPWNAEIQCSNTDCFVICIDEYEFKGENFLTCINGRWIDVNTNSSIVPPCTPICAPPCSTNTVCIAPSQCVPMPATPANSIRSCEGTKCTFTCFREKVFPDGTTSAIINYKGSWVPKNANWKTIPSCKDITLDACPRKPKVPYNVKIKCLNNECILTCAEGYKFQDQITLTCNNGKWVNKQLTNLLVIPNCEPYCLLPCLNDGICVAPNQCKCTDNYEGPNCNYTSITCEMPPVPANCRRTCGGRSCTFNCFDGTTFPDGSSRMISLWKGGKWVPQNTALKNIPDCKAICEQPCLNGGTCIATNQCMCVGNYAGPTCKDKMCHKLPFSINSERVCNETTCTLTCNEGEVFPDGNNKAIVMCIDGEWVPENTDWKGLPQCEATCSPPCLNNGKCVAKDICRCVGKFKGQHCEEAICSKPPVPLNSKEICLDKMCIFTCNDGLAFPNGATKDYLLCKNGGWVQPTTHEIVLAACTDSPKCSPHCLNNGLCIATNQCICMKNFMGSDCRDKVCKKFPIPVNSKAFYHHTTYDFTCFDDYAFPDGNKKAIATCKDGVWVPENTAWKTMPDCKQSNNPIMLY